MLTSQEKEEMIIRIYTRKEDFMEQDDQDQRKQNSTERLTDPAILLRDLAVDLKTLKIESVSRLESIVTNCLTIEYRIRLSD